MRSMVFAARIIVFAAILLAACTREEPAEPQISETEDAAAQTAAPEVSTPAAPAPAPAPAPSTTAPTPAPPAPAPVAPAPEAAAAAPPEPPRVFEVAAGTALVFTLIDSLSTETLEAGQTFEASLADALVIDGETRVPRNALATGRVIAVRKPGNVSGVARLELAMTEILVDGEAVELQTTPLVVEAARTRGEDAARIGIGAGIGAAIGAALGGGRGAAIGAAIGGGGGTAVVLATEGDHIVLEPETRVSFELSETLRITEP